MQLDEYIVEYIHIQKNQLKLIRRLKRLTPNDQWLIQGEKIVIGRIKLYESFLINPEKKYKKKINIKRTINRVFYMVKFVYFLKVLLKRKKKHEKEPQKTQGARHRS